MNKLFSPDPLTHYTLSMLNRGVLIFYGQPHRRLVARDGQTKRQGPGDFVLCHQRVGRHARCSRRRMGAYDAEKVNNNARTYLFISYNIYVYITIGKSEH